MLALLHADLMGSWRATALDHLLPALGGARRYATRVRAILRRRLPAIAGFTALMLLLDVARATTIGMAALGSLSHDLALQWGLLTGGLMAAVVTAPALVEATGVHGWRRIVATIGVMLAFVGVVMRVLLQIKAGPVVDAVALGVVASNAAFLMSTGWVHVGAGLLFAVFCHARDRELDAIRAARTATLERAGAERDIVEMRLQVIQARVEPEILFDALADVRATYARDAAAADALLDDLIAYLRAALPQMRKGASTVAREARLAEAYLRVLPAGRDGRLVAELVVDDAAQDEPFPPLVLLPLVHAAADGGARVVRIVAVSATPTTAERALEIALVCESIPGGWSDDALSGARAILVGSLGPAATLRIGTAANGATARVTWSPTAGPPTERATPAARESR